MAGFREFVTGEVLTAANVDDFLMKQVVQKYADAAARDAALGTAVAGGNALREGMIAYLDSTDEVIKYDGTAWTSVGPGKILQIVRAIDSTNRSTTSTVFVDASLSVTISPTRNDSAVILIASLTAQSVWTTGNGENTISFRITDASNNVISGANDARFGVARLGADASNSSAYDQALVIAYATPATTDATTFKVRFRTTVNTTAFLQNSVFNPSQMYAIEVGP